MTTGDPLIMIDPVTWLIGDTFHFVVFAKWNKKLAEQGEFNTSQLMPVHVLEGFEVCYGLN